MDCSTNLIRGVQMSIYMIEYDMYFRLPIRCGSRVGLGIF